MKIYNINKWQLLTLWVLIVVLFLTGFISGEDAFVYPIITIFVFPILGVFYTIGWVTNHKKNK